MKMMINTEKLKKDLASMRDSKEQSMDAACKEIGISKPTYSRMENGNTPDALTLLKVSKWLGVNPNIYLKTENL
jgi:transcriptional regulator with XRE-family HTH domain